LFKAINHPENHKNQSKGLLEKVLKNGIFLKNSLSLSLSLHQTMETNHQTTLLLQTDKQTKKSTQKVVFNFKQCSLRRERRLQNHKRS
jgi:hypothetical protein